MFRKIFNYFIIFIAFPSLVFAQIVDPIGPGENVVGDGANKLLDQIGSGVAKDANIADLIIKYINFSLPYLALAAFVAFIYSGFLYVTAYGSDDNIEKSKKIIIYTVVGIIVVVVSYAVVDLFTSNLADAVQ